MRLFFWLRLSPLPAIPLPRQDSTQTSRQSSARRFRRRLWGACVLLAVAGRIFADQFERRLTGGSRQQVRDTLSR